MRTAALTVVRDGHDGDVGASVIVSGMVAATPGQGGASWAVLQYLVGLRDLGVDVHLVEPVETADAASSEAATRCNAALEAVGLGDRWCIVGSDGSTAGLDEQRLRSLGRRADALVNVSGMLRAPQVLESVPVRVYLDLDPAFIQLWHTEGIDMQLDAHTHFVSISDAVGDTIPDCGRRWLPTLPPVSLPHWQRAGEVRHDALTTIANWRGYGSIERDGVHYGQKAHSLRPLFDLPHRVAKPISLALSIHEDEVSDLDQLRTYGWGLLDPLVVAGTPAAYRDFVQGSWAELGIAKSGYVVSASGWFSDRSACYLASGRPVIAQDTGFGRRLPTGRGLLSFTDATDVAAGVDALLADYDGHRDAARSIAEDHLDARRVLTHLLDAVLS